MKTGRIGRVLVVGGAGIMGQGIAQSLAQSGLKVRLVDVSEGALEHGLRQIEANLALFAEYGLLKEDIPSILARLEPVAFHDLLVHVDGCQFVVETVPERLELKQEVFAALDECDPSTIISSNTSSCSVASLSDGCRSASRMIGVHYFNPAHIMPLVEIHYSARTDAETVAATRELLALTGKTPVVVKKDVFGLLGTRIQLAMAREVEALLAAGVASAEDLDTVARASYGLRHACIGNLEAYDMVGLETMVAIERRIFGELSAASGPSDTLVAKVERGDLGVKSGRGWFDYGEMSKEEVLDGQNRRLIRQAALLKEFENEGHYERLYRRTRTDNRMGTNDASHEGSL